MYTIVGGNPFTSYTGTTTFTGLRVVGNYYTFEEMKDSLKKHWDECYGLIIPLYNGRELEYDEDGNFIENDELR